jgi:hypothetical protein
VAEDEHEVEDENALPFLTGRGAGRFVVRRLDVAPGVEIEYLVAEWRGALVVVAGGEIEVETRAGTRCRFVDGDVLWFDGLGVGCLRNPSDQPAVLVAVRPPA